MTTKFIPAALCAVSLALAACSESETATDTAETEDAAAMPADTAAPASAPAGDDPDTNIAINPDGAEMRVDGDDVDLSVSTADPAVEAEIER